MTRVILMAAASAFCLAGAHAGEPVTFSDLDLNADGYVSETEFVGWKTASGEKTETEALEAFGMIDADASGLITSDEMDAAMSAAEEASDTVDDVLSDDM